MDLVLDRTNKDYDSFEDTFIKVLNRHASMKKKFVRANEVLYMTKIIKKAKIKASKT